MYRKLAVFSVAEPHHFDTALDPAFGIQIAAAPDLNPFPWFISSKILKFIRLLKMMLLVAASVHTPGHKYRDVPHCPSYLYWIICPQRLLHNQ
jgi:hypothetical protein